MNYRAALSALVTCLLVAAVPARAQLTHEHVERAIQGGIRFLEARQQPDGSWPGTEGTSELAALALVTAGVPLDDPVIARALARSSRFDPFAVNRTYANGLQSMLLAAAGPAVYRDVLTADARWLVDAMVKPGPVDMRRPLGNIPGARMRRFEMGPGSWTYGMRPSGVGDHSNSQYAVLGLFAAGESGVRIDPSVWAVVRGHWEVSQNPDGGWGYSPGGGNSTGSMTTAGVSSLIMSGLTLSRDRERIVASTVRDCGFNEVDRALQAGIGWIAGNFSVQTNPNMGNNHLYYLYGLERAGRLSGLRYFGRHDWYREGAEELVRLQNGAGFWSADHGPIVSTSFALLFLAKGRSPVLINKLAHGRGRDWDNDRDDVRNLVGLIGRDWGHLLTWQVVDPESAAVEAWLQAPIAFFNGHAPPTFSREAGKRLREYVESGGFVFADACCDSAAFDQGFRALMKAVFPEPEFALKRVPPEHAVWRSRHVLKPEDSPLWGIDYGCRTVVIYSPHDLSCAWNQLTRAPEHALVVRASRVGQNVIEYATGRELPADKLSAHVVTRFEADGAKRGALQIAKLKHGGDWNVAPLAVPNLMSALHGPPLNFDVVLHHKELTPRDPNLIYYPLIYIHGRAVLSFDAEEMACLRRHLNPGGGTLFADAACSSAPFDTSFRKFAAALFPGHALEPIPPDDPIYSTQIGFDLSKSELNRTAGGARAYPRLEGIKLDRRWALIYSKTDIGCALERPQGVDCPGYTHESALKIAANIVIYSTQP